MRRIMITTLCALASAALAKPFSEIAPADAAFVLEVPSMQRMMEGAERAGLRAMFEDRVMRDFIEAIAADSEVSLRDLLDELRVDLDDLSLPSGQVGMAMGLPDVDADWDESPPIVMFAEFDGESGAALRDAMDTIIEEGLDRRMIQLQDIDPVGDVRIVGIDSLIADELDAEREKIEEEFSRRLEALREEGDWEAWGEIYEWYESALDGVGSDDPMERAVQMMFEDMQDVYFAWVDDALVVGASADDVADAVTAMDRGRRESLAGTRFFADSLASLPREHHARLLINNQLLQERSREEIDPEFVDDMTATMEAMGLNSQTGTAISLTLGEGGEVLRTDGVTFLSAVRGVFELIDLNGPAFAGSPVLPNDAVVGGRLLFDFQSLLQVVNRAVAGMPEESRERLQPAIAQFGGIAAPILAELGPEVFVGLTDFDPSQVSLMQVDGEGTPAIVGIAVRNEQIISNVITTFGAQVGVAAREYAGAQIFEVDGLGLSAGLGYGHLVIANKQRTEDALRRLGDPTIKAFGSSPEFAAAMRTIDPTGYGVVCGEFEAVSKLLRSFVTSTIEQRTQWDEDYEVPAWVEKLPEASFFGKYLGGFAVDQHMGEGGLRGRIVVLKP